MKKILSVILCLILVLSFCGCQTKIFKQIEFKNTKLYDKSIIFNIPDDWYYTEVAQMGILFNLADADGKVMASGMTSLQDVSFEKPLSQIVIDQTDVKIIEINNNVFCAFNKDNQHKVYVRLDGKLIIIAFEKDVPKNIIKSIAQSIKIRDNDKKAQESTVSDDHTPPEDLGTVDLSILESAEALDRSYPEDTIGAIYNTLDRISPIFEREWISNIADFADSYNYAYFALECDDGYFYRFVENYATNNFELWKSVLNKWEKQDYTYDLVYAKPLPKDCNVLTTHRDYIINRAPYQIITIEQVEKIIETGNISALYRKELPLTSYQLTESGNFFSTEYYVPEALAYFHIVEDYSTNMGGYSFSPIVPQYESVPTEYDKYNVSKKLSPNAKIENHKKHGLHFEDGVVIE